VDINERFNPVSKISHPSLMREIWILFTVFVLHHWIATGIDLPEADLIANIVILQVIDSRYKLAVNPDDIVLVLVNTILDHVGDESIERLNLLVNNTVLRKE
jgi:hypothetical protein